MKEELGIRLAGDEKPPSIRYKEEDEYLLESNTDDVYGPGLVGGSKIDISNTLYNESILD